MKTRSLHDAISIALLAVAAGISGPALAGEPSVAAIPQALPVEAGSLSESDFDVPAGELAVSLDLFEKQSGIQIRYQVADVAGRQASAIHDRMTWPDALSQMLYGSGLGYRRIDSRTVVIEPRSSQATRAATEAATGSATAATESATAATESATNLATVTVTGTRIRGGTSPSPVIVIGSERIREEGFTDLGQVIRTVPQNFNGGQNPGVIGVSGGSGKDLTGGSSLNLRGLGPDASLTLLNGRRLAYDGFSQAVDISAIPVEAVDRLEIVPDGASAIYGSDAVGGVANVILVRDFDGVAISGRYGEATDGGLATRELSATAGTTWADGGLIATLKDTITDPIYAHQRDYTDHLINPYTIYTGWDSRNGLVSLHQSLGTVAELRLDTLRTDREAQMHITQPTSHQRYALDASVALVSPSVEFFLPGGWALTIGGAHGSNEYVEERYLVAGAGSSLLSDTSIENSSRSFDVGAEGPLFAVGGGDARLAVGVGSRSNDYLQLNRTTDAGPGGSERARHAYAELNLPLVSPASDVAGIRRLEVSAALRAEDYDSFGRVTTPKFGVIYDPGANVTLKASWGKSFKAPTLNQRYLNKTSYLWSAAATGGTGYPADATVLMSYGGNENLHPERATTWTAALALHPEAWPGFDAELSVFDIDYTDRVVEPVDWPLALSSPVYAEFVDYSPTSDQQQALLAAYSTLYNLTGAAYDPANVVAIIRDQYINAARQRIKGVDLSGSYGVDLADGRLTMRGSASWIESTQKNSPDQPEYPLAGTVFNPARVNSRAGVVWASGGFGASLFANYTSGVTNELATTTEKTASFTTLDATLGYETEGAGAFSGLALGLSVRNLLNRNPPLYTPLNANYVPYDATNYSAVGRFLSVSVSKRW